ncbi:MAG: aldehyde dehydrogenase family protein [Bryobacteraceae bacterium]
MADLVETHAAAISEIESMDVGKPLSQAQGDIEDFSATARYYADLSTRLAIANRLTWLATKRDRCISPTEPAPLFSLGIFRFSWWGGAFSLRLRQNTVVIKPAEDTPLSTLYLMDLVRQSGIPDGVVNVITGYGEITGAALASHPGISRMSFTGSPEVGRLVAQSCGYNLVPVKLELGGKGAAVVFDDVDVPATAKALAQAITLNTGQVCCTASRWLIQDHIYDSFVDAAVREMSSIRIGYGRDPETQMGPVVGKNARAF